MCDTSRRWPMHMSHRSPRAQPMGATRTPRPRPRHMPFGPSLSQLSRPRARLPLGHECMGARAHESWRLPPTPTDMLAPSWCGNEQYVAQELPIQTNHGSTKYEMTPSRRQTTELGLRNPGGHTEGQNYDPASAAHNDHTHQSTPPRACQAESHNDTWAALGLAYKRTRSVCLTRALIRMCPCAAIFAVAHNPPL